MLYLDIDLHHGDGVELAFASSPFILTLSVHLHAPLFFPASGALGATGPVPPSKAAFHALNAALHPGLSSENLIRVFENCVEPVVEAYGPDCVVVQCGCDGLAGDPCAEWALGLEGIGEVVRRVVGWGKRVLLLGGGGYDHPNAARCWAYLTSVAVSGVRLRPELLVRALVADHRVAYVHSWGGRCRSRRTFHPTWTSTNSLGRRSR